MNHGVLLTDPSLFDVGLLADITDRSPTVGLLARQLKARRIEPSIFINEQCPRTTLGRTWEGTLASFDIEHRREIRRRRRNITKGFAVEFQRRGQLDTIGRDIDEFIVMHQERWTGSGYKGALSDRRVREFHRDAARAFARRGWLFLGFLCLNGRRLAVNYGFRFRSELAIYLTGMYEPGDVLKYSPGRVLTACCMEQAVQEGMAVFDFMRGAEQYKHEFDAVNVPNRTVLFYRSPSRSTERRYKSILLCHSLRRGAEREVLLWKHASHTHGMLSKGSAQHVARRIGRVISDGWLKLSAPEQTLSIRDDPARD